MLTEKGLPLVPILNMPEEDELRYDQNLRKLCQWRYDVTISDR